MCGRRPEVRSWGLFLGRYTCNQDFLYAVRSVPMAARFSHAPRYYVDCPPISSPLLASPPRRPPTTISALTQTHTHTAACNCWRFPVLGISCKLQHNSGQGIRNLQPPRRQNLDFKPSIFLFIPWGKLFVIDRQEKKIDEIHIFRGEYQAALQIFRSSFFIKRKGSSVNSFR